MIALILSLVVYRAVASDPELAIQAAAATAAEPGGDVGWFRFDRMIVLAFAIGFFPETVLRALANQARRLIRSGRRSSCLDLEALEGVDTFTRARLAENGILDATHLAACNPVTLALKTPFPLQQITDWIGQAQLLTLVKAKEFRRLQDLGVRTSYQYYDLASGDRLPPPAATSPQAQTCMAALDSDPAFARLAELADRLLGREGRKLAQLQVAAE